MKVAVIGSGGREDALRYVLGRTATLVEDPDLADLVVIGPETPLVQGLADSLRASGKLVYGPGAQGAQLEGSKQYMKDFVARAGVPTARYGSFDDVEAATAFMARFSPPFVVKTDGLASGKGVFITDSFDEAVADVRDKLSGATFGSAGRRVIIEEAMSGPEVSLLYLFDGKRGVALPAAQDFKRVGDANTGPNTGGMGAYSDVPLATPEVIGRVLDEIIEPTCWLLRRDEIDYRGTLYAGLMLTTEGPKLVEYNVRFGDPETQVVLPRLSGDVAELLASVAAGALVEDSLPVVAEQAVTVVLASADYPASSSTGSTITGIEDANEVPGVVVFAAGVTHGPGGEMQTNGGRVLDVTALAPTLSEARERAYEAVKCISFEGMKYRSDIALRASEEVTA